MNKNIMGTGWRMAPQLDRRGGIGLISNEQAVEQSLLFILGTAPGERVMRPDFGCRIHELVFALNTPRTWSKAEEYVREALIKWEPRIILGKVQATPDPHSETCLVIHVEYTIRDTNSFYNLVYPFYLEQSEKESRSQMIKN